MAETSEVTRLSKANARLKDEVCTHAHLICLPLPPSPSPHDALLLVRLQ